MLTEIPQTTSEGFTRLHISPLNPDLLKSYLGPSVAPLAKNISYHSIQTFPERSFGYLELPDMEAKKLKKKLNGSILKGQKISIDEARPEKRKRSEEDGGEDEAAEKFGKKTRRGKKAKKQDGVIEGHELEEGRKVKRGWTETPAEKRQEKESKKKSKDKSEKSEQKSKKDKKSRESSKYTNEPECLFRQTIPSTSNTSEGMEEKKSKKDKKKKSRDMVVHEFSNTTKHASFLKGANARTTEEPTREYVDGKGWVDAEGKVVEEETEKQKAKREKAERKAAKKAKQAAEAAAAAAAAEAAEKARKRKAAESSSEDSSDESSVVSSSSEEEDSASDPEEEAAEEPMAVETTPAKEVHPLEALYKRPKLASINTTPTTTHHQPGFSFFGGDEDSDIEQDDAEENDAVPPMTPFTQRDMEWRGTRSAAPTPDTAAIGKRFSFSAGVREEDDDSSDEDSEDDASEVDVDIAPSSTLDVKNPLGISEQLDEAMEDAPDVGSSSRGPKEESEFAKWFYEHRSENNKKWRARRREAMKMKRKRENRRLTRRIV